MAGDSGLPAIVQTIGVEGQEDIEKAFDSIAEAGKAAFEKLEEVASHTVFAGLAEAIAAVGVAIVGTTLALFEWSKTSVEATVEMEHLATQTGSTIENMSAMITTLGALGASTGNLEQAFKRFAVRLENDFPNVARASRDASDKMVDDHNKIIDANQAVEQSTIKLSEAYIKAADAEKAAAHTQVANAFSVQGAVLSVERAKQALAAIEGNPPTAAEQQVLKEKEARLALKQAIEAEAVARRKQEQDDQNAANVAQLAALAIREAEQKKIEAVQKAAEAVKKANEDAANSVPTLQRAVENLANGIPQDLSRVNFSVQNMVKGFEATLLDGGNSFKEFKGNASDLRNIEPALEPAFLKLMDIFHNMTDETKKMALAHQLFGRGVSQDLVAAMSVGSKAFLEFREAQKEAGLALTENDEHIAKDFHKSLNQLQGDLKVTAEQIGNLFAPGFTAGFNILDEAIRKSHPELLKFASDIANQVKPIITDLFRLLAGEEPKITWILVIQQALSNLGSFITSSVKPVIGDLLRLLAGQQVQTPWVRTVVELLNSLGSTIKGIVIPAFELLIGFIDKIKNTINDAFGTNLSKMDVVFLYALGRMTGALGLLGSLLLLVPGWITAAFVIGAGIYLFWDKIVEVATAAFEKIKAKVLELRNYMAETLGTSAADVILAGLGTALLAGIALIGTRMAIGLATAFVTALVGLPGLAEAAIGVVGLAIAAALVTAIIKGMQLLSNKTAPKPLGSAGPANPDEDGEKVPLPKSRPGSAPAADKSVTEQLKALVADHEASIKSAVTGTHELAAATHDAAEKIKGATDKLKGSEFSKDKGTIRTNPFFDNPNAQGDVVTGGPGLIKNNPFFQPPPTPTSSDKKTEANASLEEFSAGLKKVNPELEKTGTDLNTTDTAFSKASTDVATAETSLKTTTDTADTSVESLGTQAGVTTEALLGLDGKWTGLGDTLDSVTGKLKDFLDALDKKSGDSGTSSSAPDSSSDDGPSPVAGKAAGGPVWGAGHSTSDSIDAKLSHGEFVMQTKSVEKYGQPFMHAVNEGKFNLGGLVQGVTNVIRLAAGGAATTANHISNVIHNGYEAVARLASGGSAGDTTNIYHHQKHHELGGTPKYHYDGSVPTVNLVSAFKSGGLVRHVANTVKTINQVVKMAQGGFAGGGSIARAIASPMPTVDFSSFAVGGLAGAMNSQAPARLASGGKASGERPAVFILDGNKIPGITMTNDAFSQMSKYAIKKQTASLGRKGSAIR